MVLRRVEHLRDRLKRDLSDALGEEHTPQEVAVSFSIGIFVTALPTGGLGLGLFVIMAYLWEWVSKTALLTAVVVLNPLVKPVVYLASFQVGSLLIGSEPVVTAEHSSVNSVLLIVQQILIGNLIIAAVLAGVSYVVVLRWSIIRSSEDADEPNVSPISVFLPDFDRWFNRNR